jgi:cytochrome P450
VIAELSRKTISTIEENKDKDISDLFTRFTIDVLGKTIFNYDFNRIDGENNKYYEVYNSIFLWVFSFPGILSVIFPIFQKLPLKTFSVLKNDVGILIQFFGEMIEEQKKNPDKRSILSKLLSENEATHFSKDEIISDVWALFFAGHETTAISLLQILNCLRAYPRKQEKLYEEIKNNFGTDGVPSQMSEVNQLVYLDCFLQEVLRMYTPGTLVLAREATEDIQYKDQFIPKGTQVGLYYYMLLRHSDYWVEPEKFSPKRFRPEQKKNRPHFLNIPFGAGPRQCLGMNLSIYEQKIFLIMLLQKYRVVDPVEHKPFTGETYSFVTKPPVYVRFIKR